MSQSTPLPEGTLFDSGTIKYRVVKTLGRGGFGITYLVLGEIKQGNVFTEATFAIKEHFPAKFCRRDGEEVVALDDKNAEYEASKTDFINEARRLQSLCTRIDNIVKVNEVFESRGTAYYVMEYINGDSLSEYVGERGKLSFREAADLLAPVFKAVGQLHESRINHLDIKPDNIMLKKTATGLSPVLIDFGLSVHFKKNGGKTTPKGVEGYSEGYSPLEQYAGIKEFIPATDIYALAATFLYAITGERPAGASELKQADIRQELAGKAPRTAIDALCKAFEKSYEVRTGYVPELMEGIGMTAVAESSYGGKPTDPIVHKDSNFGKLKKVPAAVLYTVCIVAVGALAFVAIKAMRGEGDKATQAVAQTEVCNQWDSTEQVAEQPESVQVENLLSASDQPVAAQVANLLSGADQSEESQNEPERESKQPVAAQQSAPRQSTSYEGTLSFGYATWRGEIRNGRPDGSGTLTFHTTHRVDSHVNYDANPGDYLKGSFENGQLVYGDLYDASGNFIKNFIP